MQKAPTSLKGYGQERDRDITLSSPIALSCVCAYHPATNDDLSVQFFGVQNYKLPFAFLIQCRIEFKLQMTSLVAGLAQGLSY